MDRRISTKHTFDAGDGWSLCLWCGCTRQQGPHFKTALPAGFNPIHTAPKNATTIRVVMENGQEHDAHWAQDLSGEDQPPFMGWFIPVLDGYGGLQGYRGIDAPMGWKLIDK